MDRDRKLSKIADEIKSCSHGKIYFITYHPSAARRFSRVKQEFLKDFRSLTKLVKSNS